MKISRKLIFITPLLIAVILLNGCSSTKYFMEKMGITEDPTEKHKVIKPEEENRVNKTQKADRRVTNGSDKEETSHKVAKNTKNVEQIKSPIKTEEKQIQQTETSPTSSGKTEKRTRKNQALSEDRVDKKLRKQSLARKQDLEKKRRSTHKNNSRMNVAFNFEDADIYEVLNIMLGEVLKINYIVDPSVRGKVTIHTEGVLNRGDLFNLVESILQINGLAMVETGNNLYKIVPSSRIPALGGLRRSSGISYIEIIPLHFISTQSIAPIIKNLMSPGAVIMTDPRTNSLILSDNPNTLDKVKKIVKVLDTNLFSRFSFELIPLKYLDCNEMVSILDNAFSEIKGKWGVRWIPIKSTNSLLLFGDSKEALESAKKWITALDTGGEEQGVNIYIYPVENGNAEEIADILKQLYGKTTTTHTKRRVLVSAKRKISGIKGVSTAETTGEVKIIADKVNNLIVVKASAKDYKAIRKVIKSMDIIPRQVLIEVLIAEVTLNKNINFGVEWYFKSHTPSIHGSKYPSTGSLSAGNLTPLPPYENGLTGNTPAGFTYAIYTNAGDLRALITALSEVSEINILSSPVIMATDNQEAKIDVGKEVPILTQSVTNTGASNPNITNSIEYKNTGILLTVKPHINSGGLVSLDIDQEVSQPQANTTSGIDSPIFLKRKAKTHVVVKDGETIIFGGLIQENKTLTETGIPFLMDIPIIGMFFRRTEWKRDRTELLIAITPHVVRDIAEARRVTEEFKKKINKLKSLLKTEKGFLIKKEKRRERKLIEKEEKNR